jgi:hypothetical protein
MADPSAHADERTVRAHLGSARKVAMIWAVLVFLGVPLWLCALGILGLLYRNRALRKRHGDIPVRVLRPGKTRWTRGHAVWVADVFAWRGSPAAWNEALELIASARLQDPSEEDRKKLRHVADAFVVASLTTDDGIVLRVAASAEHRAALIGPFDVMTTEVATPTD